MKKKIVAMSVLTIVLCASLIIGATLALFSSRSDVNIAVSSGKVEISAAIDEKVSLYSPTAISNDGTVTDAENAATDTNFKTGGTATVSNGQLAITNIAPGDKVTFKIDITNSSNVNYQQRLTFSLAEGSETLYNQLLIGVGTEEGTYTYYGSSTEWMEKDAATTSDALYLSVELPAYAGNSAQDKSCTVRFTLEAAQKNANVTDESDPVHTVDSADALASLMSGNTVKDIDKIILGGSASNWVNAEVSLSFEDAKTLYISGYKVGTMTINAAQGTVYVFNDAGSITGAKVAEDSLHVYGSVGNLTVNSGRAVVEEGAAVGTVSAIPNENSEATVIFAENITVEKLVVDTSATNSSTNLTIAENVVIPSFKVDGSGNVTLENNGTIESAEVGENTNISGESTVQTAAALIGALQAGGTVELAADITTSQQLVIPEGVTVTLNLNGYNIAGSNAGTLICNRGTITINDTNAAGETDTACVYTTNIEAQGRHVLENYGTMTVNNGTFGDSDTDRTNANSINRGNAVRNYGTMTVYGGYFTACDNYTNGGYAYAFASGPIEGTEASLTINYAHAYGRINGLLSSDGGLVTVNNGVYTLGYGTETNLWRIVYTSRDGVVVLNGGTYTRNVNNNYAFFGANGTGNITVKGGTYTDLIHDYILVDGNANTIIEGGEFDAGFSGTMVQDNRTEFNVSSAEELRYIAGLVNAGDTFAGKTINLVKDIDLGGVEWTPIGTAIRSGSAFTGNTFSGTFDGNGHTISGLKITSSPSNEDFGIGLFNSAKGATIKNFTLENVEINVKGDAVAAAVGLVSDDATISGINTSGTIEGGDGVGGIVGRMLISGTIENCTNEAAISASGKAGGIVGAAYYTQQGKEMTISSCENSGAVTSTAGYVGGIVGLNAGNISDCTNSGAVTGSGTSIGGIVGEQQSYGNVTNNINTADVENLSKDSGTFGTGGIVGWVRYNGADSDYGRKEMIEVTGNTNEGSVTGGGSSGGIVGHIYNVGVVSGNTNTAAQISSLNFAAGIVGSLQYADGNTYMEEQCDIKVTGNVSTTPESSISGDYTDQYAYNNRQTQGDFVVKDNSSTPPQPAEGIDVAYNGSTTLTVGDSLNKADFVVTVHYADGSSSQLSAENFEISPDGALSRGGGSNCHFDLHRW